MPEYEIQELYQCSAPPISQIPNTENEFEIDSDLSDEDAQELL